MVARAIVIGFRRWRAWNLAGFLRAQAQNLVLVRDVAAAWRLNPGRGDVIMVWGAAAPRGLAELLRDSGAALVRIEDGFIRSVGLGSDLIAPYSLVFDDCGIYFDATGPSRLEMLLATHDFDPDLLARAGALRAMVVARGLTKYNVEDDATPVWAHGGRPVVLVPGQVESDASLALGGGRLRTNQALLAAVRAARPDAFVVYKPHPDVTSGNRRGRLWAQNLADHVETGASLIACLALSDEVHTMTSLAGFDALLRGLRVVTYGAPFYAGWGLTSDMATGHPAWTRRGRTLSCDALVAAALLLYPQYRNPVSGKSVPAEAAIDAIAAERDHLRQTGAAPGLLHGFWRRQGRKLRVQVRAWTSRRAY